MFSHPYVMEKLIELDGRRATRFSYHELPPSPRRGHGLALSVGRAMRRTGERLEAWGGSGNPQSRSDYCSEARRY